METLRQYHRSGRSLDHLEKTLYEFSSASGFEVNVITELQTLEAKEKEGVQSNPTLRTPTLYGHLSNVHIFSIKFTRLIRTPVNTDNGQFFPSRPDQYNLIQS